VQQIDLAFTLFPLLRQHPVREVQLPPEECIEGGLPQDCTLNVPNNVRDLGFQRPQAALGALGHARGKRRVLHREKPDLPELRALSPQLGCGSLNHPGTNSVDCLLC
jgi:hypothetical protein